MIGRLEDLTMTRDGKYRLAVTVSEPCGAMFDELKEMDVDIQIKKASNKRSLNANAYAWVLIDKIAEKMGIKKEEVYRQQIRSIGGVSEIVCVQDKAVDTLRRMWSHNGLGWQSEVMQSKIGNCTNLILYYGSSTYDTKQMSTLIDSLVQDAEALGIPTMPDSEIEKLKQKWGVDLGKEHHTG